MREIQLNHGQVAKVDDADYEELSKYKWSAIREYYGWRVTRSGPRVNGQATTVPMGRAILNAPKGMIVDHRDGDGLNNQRENLRLCTHAENMRNRRRPRNNRSGFKGVTWVKQDRVWAAHITVDRTHKTLGRFSTAEEAARAYDEAALKYHGEFARLNIYPSQEE